MKKLKLANNENKFILVDNEDFERFSKFKWSCYFGYAINTHGERMHRLILKVPKNKQIDHINGNRLDNRKSNLRIVTNQQNCMNRAIRKDNTNGYKGVIYQKADRKYRALITVYGKRIYLGYFKTKEEAAYKYNEAANKYFGEFARLNVV